MRSVLIFLLSSFMIFGMTNAQSSNNNYRLEFASEFIRGLVEMHQSEDAARRDIDGIKKDAEYMQKLMSSIIRNSTLTKMRLQVRLNRLEKVEINDKNFDILVPAVADLYSRKMALYQEIVLAAQAIIAGQRPDVDYGRLAGHIPEITAQIEFLDESLFKVVPMVGMLLISPKPDSKGQLSHFSITRNEAQKLISALENGFGKSLDENDQNWTTSSASVLRTYLRDKGFKFSDDKWE